MPSSSFGDAFDLSQLLTFNSANVFVFFYYCLYAVKLMILFSSLNEDENVLKSNKLMRVSTFQMSSIKKIATQNT